MIEFYPQIKTVHIVCVVLSGTLFALRGGLMLAGSPLANVAALRHLSYLIDTTLLTAALMLVSMLHVYPLVSGWLTLKIALIVLYIGLGSIALRRGRELRTRRIAFVAALMVYAFVATIARAHHPLGFLAYWPGDTRCESASS
jgi:uncharacterized membrane protein SirB2